MENVMWNFFGILSLSHASPYMHYIMEMGREMKWKNKYLEKYEVFESWWRKMKGVKVALSGAMRVKERKI